MEISSQPFDYKKFILAKMFCQEKIFFRELPDSSRYDYCDVEVSSSKSDFNIDKRGSMGSSP
jgi:hypothetical protein